MPGQLDVPTANLRLGRHLQTTPLLEQEIPLSGQRMENQHQPRQTIPQSHGRMLHLGPVVKVPRRQLETLEHPEIPQLIPLEETIEIRPLLLPLKRRLVRNPLTNQITHSCTTTSEEGFLKY